MECTNCGGRGEVRRFNPATRERWLAACPECLGTGMAMSPMQREMRLFMKQKSRWVPVLLAVIAILVGAIFALRFLQQQDQQDGEKASERQPAEAPGGDP